MSRLIPENFPIGVKHTLSLVLLMSSPEGEAEYPYEILFWEKRVAFVMHTNIYDVTLLFLIFLMYQYILIRNI